jgi:6-phosphogluconate dehydrogenase
MKIGMVGLGRMGAGMSERLRRAGHEVVGYDRDPQASHVASLAELVSALEAPRAVWVMVPAGDPTEQTIQDLAVLLAAEDLVVEGGNSWYRDSIRRAQELRSRGIGFVDAGVSGGIWGLREGFCLMVGGGEDDIARVRPVFDALAPEGGFVHAGPVGAGHFTKMVHNGVEYALMQAYAEGYQLLLASDLDVDVERSMQAWRHGSVVRSWLLDLLAEALTENPGLEGIRPWVEDSGEGRWTVQEAVRLGVPVPAISAALFGRFASRDESSPALRALAVLRQRFGGHAVKS